MELGGSSRIGRITDRESQIKTQGHSHDHYSQTKPPIVMPSLESVTREKLEVAGPQESSVVEKSKTQGIRDFESVLRAQVTVGVAPCRLA